MSRAGVADDPAPPLRGASQPHGAMPEPTDRVRPIELNERFVTI